jgi:recombination protein RecT
MTDTQIATRTPSQDLVARVRGDEFKSQVALALPEGIAPERFVRLTITALMQNPSIAEADPDTIFAALLRSAQDGLVPDGREAALVVYSGKAQYLPMIGGFRKIAAEHGWALQTAVVREGDLFEHEQGLEPVLRHAQATPAKRGDIIAAYCVARHRNGEKLVEVMQIDELNKIRSKSKKANSGPWSEWEDRMYEKTVGKRTFAKLPLYGTDQELDRIRRLAADHDDPAAAASLYYGGERPALSSGMPDDPPADGDALHASDAAAGPQAEAAAPPSAAASAPDTDDEPEPGTTAPVADAENDQLANLAAQTLVPSGKRQGQTLAEVAADGDDGFGWIVWAMGPARAWNKGESEFGTALRVFVKHRLPDAAEAAATKYADAA